MDIKKVGVVGAGAMGTGIAHTSAQNGHSVIVCDISEEALEKSKSSIIKVFDKSIARGKSTIEEMEKTLKNLKFTTDLNELADVDLVIEAVVEKLDVKMDIFSKLDNICSPKTILASNTSTMSITKLATATKRADKFAGAHFFNPAPVMRLVEVIRGYYTSDETVQDLMKFVKNLNKEGIEVKKDTPGFVVNRLMLPQFREALIVYEEGIASIEDIDKAMTLGLNHPMGPFTLMDFTGIEITYDSLVYLYEQFAQSHWAPPASLKRIIDAGRLGKKTNAGWYDYE